jgi:hypothetical protein
MANSNDNAVWVSGPSMTIRDDHREVLVFHIPNGAKYLDWRKKTGNWHTKGSASVSVYYVEANSKSEIHKRFEEDHLRDGGGKLKVFAEPVLPGMSAGLAGSLRRHRRDLDVADVKTYFKNRAIVVEGKTKKRQTLTGKSSKIDVQVEICLEYESDISKWLSTIRGPKAAIVLFLVVALAIWWTSVLSSSPSSTNTFWKDLVGSLSSDICNHEWIGRRLPTFCSPFQT